MPSVMLNFYILPPGTDKLISQCPALLHDSELVEAPCSKNTGLTKKLRKWSRGHQFIVRAGGHIDMGVRSVKLHEIGTLWLVSQHRVKASLIVWHAIWKSAAVAVVDTNFHEEGNKHSAATKYTPVDINK